MRAEIPNACGTEGNVDILAAVLQVNIEPTHELHLQESAVVEVAGDEVGFSPIVATAQTVFR